MMDIIQMSVVGAVLIVLTAIVRAVGLRRLPKSLYLILWGIVVTRLLVPFGFSSPFSAYGILMRIGEPVLLEAPFGQSVGQVPFSSAAQGAQQALTAVTPMPLPGTVSTIMTLTMVWAAGFIVALLFFAVLYRRSYRHLAHTIPVDNALVDEWLAANPFKRPLRVLQSSGVATPVALGIIKPRIILPSSLDMDNRKLLDFILTHEACHLRRLDTLWKMVLAVTVCVHWFNPLVWVMFILANRDLELSCDEMVMRHLGTCNKTAYALSLIDMAEHSTALLSAAYQGFSAFAAEERIGAIMRFKKTTRTGIVLSMVIVAGLFLVAFTTEGGPGAATDPLYMPVRMDKSLEGYLVEQGFLEQDIIVSPDGPEYVVWYFNGKRVSAIQDSFTWKGADYTGGVWLDSGYPFYDSLGESVCLQTVRDGETNQIVSLVKLPDGKAQVLKASFPVPLANITANML
jgi:beta-lactamase regulating signal transducer with metallopeptidase domain